MFVAAPFRGKNHAAAQRFTFYKKSTSRIACPAFGHVAAIDTA